MTRNDMICFLKFCKRNEVELTDQQESILIKEECYKLAVSFYKIHQLGDPAVLRAKYTELVQLIDKEIKIYEESHKEEQETEQRQWQC